MVPRGEEYYEAIASQEQTYLDGVEENLREILSEELRVAEKATSATTAGLDEDLDHAAQDLVVGDSDDPPVDEATVAEFVDATSMARQRINGK